MRPPEEWADRMYQANSPLAHWVPWGTERTLCGAEIVAWGWYGTGDFDEYENARGLEICGPCQRSTGADGIQI